MLALKIFWLDLDKFPGDAAKIIDQSQSFLLWREGGGGGGGSSDFPVVQGHELLMITAIRSIRRTTCDSLLLARMTHATEY